MHTLRTVDDALALREASGTRAVVLGAGFIGIEAVEALAHRGFETHLVEFAEHVLPPLEVEMATLVTQELRGLGVCVHASVAAQSIAHSDDHDSVTLSDGTVLTADVIVLSTGVRPDTAFAEAAGIETEGGYILVDEHGRTSADDVYAVGDGTRGRDHERPVTLAGPANRGGRLVADVIADAEHGKATARPIPRPQGTAIVRIGSLTAAMTGANRQALDASGAQYFTVHTHANQHAGYFPGAKPVHILMHVGTDGQILGAQAVGADGVDRRIDVIATAMRAGLSATDLIDLDLAYAPPYGQAKDPVNQTGMVAHNVLAGELVLTGPDALTEDMPVLDVRTPGEYAAGHMPNSSTSPTPSCATASKRSAPGSRPTSATSPSSSCAPRACAPGSVTASCATRASTSPCCRAAFRRCGRGSEIGPRPSSLRGRAKPADPGLENAPASEFEGVEFHVKTESITTDRSEHSVLRPASCDGATGLRRAEARNTMARIQ